MKPNVQRKGSIIPQPPVVKSSKVKKVTNRHFVSPLVELKNGVVVDPSTKIKLQLFPVDEVTRIGLEKDGLNPFLELTLSARKKISSVINHIQTKWGGSSVAIGELMLLHSDTQRRYTSKNAVITAGDVYTAVGTPAVFRLSYGWFAEHENQRGSSASTALQNCVKAEIMEKQIETTEERKYPDATTAEINVAEHVDTKVNKDHNSHDMNMTNLSMGGEAEASNISNKTELQPISVCTDISIGGLLSEVSLQGKFQNNEQILNGRNTEQTPIQWDDGLTTLSIGGLLSEASLQAKINKPNNRDISSTFNSDSFDAIISSQVKTNPQPHSILDAEETCHAFSFRKFSASSKNVRVSARATQDSTSNSFKFPHLLQAEKQGENASSSEPKTQLFPRLPPPQYGEDSRSLGLRGLTWNESLGPFDLGNSMPWRGNV